MILRHARRCALPIKRGNGSAVSITPARTFATPLPTLGVPSRPPPSPEDPLSQPQPGSEPPPSSTKTATVGAAAAPTAEEKRVENMTPEAPWTSQTTSSPDDHLTDLFLSCLRDLHHHHRRFRSRTSISSTVSSLAELHGQMRERARTQLPYDLAYEPTPDSDRRVSLEQFRPRLTWQQVAQNAAMSRKEGHVNNPVAEEEEDDGIVLVAHIADFADCSEEPVRTSWCTGFAVTSGERHGLVVTCAHTLEAVSSRTFPPVPSFFYVIPNTEAISTVCGNPDRTFRSRESERNFLPHSLGTRLPSRERRVFLARERYCTVLSRSTSATRRRRKQW
jgi:hypothetical protein